MKIGFDAKRYYHNRTGLGNYSRTLADGVIASGSAECVLYDEKSFSRTFRLAHKAKADGCDVFHGLSNELPLDSLRAHIPTVVTMHDVAWRTFPDMYHWADRQIYDAKYGWACRHATRVVAISQSTKADVMRFYGVSEDRIDVVCQPVQPLFYQQLDAETARQQVREALPWLPSEFALYVGSINSRKNLLLALRALAAISEDRRPFLLVVGNGREYRREVEQYIATAGLQSCVRIADNLRDNNLLHALYATAMFFIYPSYYEGFGLPVVEASLQTCPVITTNVSSLPEAAGDGAILISPDDVEACSDAIGRLTTDGDLRNSLGQKGRAYATSHFMPQFQTDRMLQIYHSLINR